MSKLWIEDRSILLHPLACVAFHFTELPLIVITDHTSLLSCRLAGRKLAAAFALSTLEALLPATTNGFGVFTEIQRSLAMVVIEPRG